MQLTAEEICARLPHTGNMCLLSRVEYYDQSQLRCYAISHRSINNPLFRENKLNAIYGIEYAAQAIGLHSGLRNELSDKPKLGYLVALRKVVLEVKRLDDIESELSIECNIIGRDQDLVVSEFAIRGDRRCLIWGRATLLTNTA